MKEGGPSISIGRKILRASLVVGTAHMLFKLVSVIQTIVLGHYLDDRTYDVVYAFAFEGCLLSIFLIGEEVIGPSFLPVFMRELDTKDERTAWQFANIVLTLQFILLLAVVCLVMVFPDSVIRLMTAWTPLNDAAKYDMGRRTLVWLAPSLICLSLGSTTYILLNGYKRFFLAAMGDTSWKFCVLIAVLAGMGIFGMDYRAVILGLLAGSVAKLLTHLTGLLREARFFRFSLDLRNPALRSMLLLLIPLICGIVFAKVRDIYNNVTILSYLDTEGLMKANSFGRKLYQTIGWLIPYALSIAIFPFFCELVDKNDKDAFGQLLSRSGRMLLSVFIPLSLVCAVLAVPMTYVLYHGGAFTGEAVQRTAVSMACYVLVLPAYALEPLLMQAFFANRRMISVTVAGIFFSMFSMAVSYVGVMVFQLKGVAALAVIALGYTLSRWLKAAALTWLLKRSVPFFPLRETALFLARTLLVGAVSAGGCLGGCRLFEHVVNGLTGRWLLLLKLGVGAAGALAGFALSARLLGLQEPMEMLTWARARVRDRLSSRSPGGADSPSRKGPLL